MERRHSGRPEREEAVRKPFRSSATRAAEADILHIQKTAGNRAVGAWLLQRALSGVVQRTVGDGHDLGSPRFAGETLLEATFDDEAKVKRGSASSAATPIQQALVDAGPLTGKLYVLGTTGPKGDGVDGVFGSKTEAAVKKFQTDQALGSAPGHVGPKTMARLDELFRGGGGGGGGGGGTPPVPPTPTKTFKVGDKGTEVAQAQQKLNAARLGIPKLSINGIFGIDTGLAVFLFQLKKGISPATGVLDQVTLDALNTAVPGGGVDPSTNIEDAVNSGERAEPLGTRVPGKSLHPRIGTGEIMTGPAVREAQQKLNIWNAAQAAPGVPLAEDGFWKPEDRERLALFQVLHAIIFPLGRIDDVTWNELDREAPGARSGYIRREWTQTIGGRTTGMTGGLASRYSWSLDALPGGGDIMNVTAKVNFASSLAPSADWFGFVSTAWNVFAAENEKTHEKINIDFRLISGTGSDANTVVVRDGEGRANAGEWFLGDTRAAQTIPHEYGHLIGLADEYQLHPADYRRVTGHEPTVGDATGPAGITPEKMAKDMQDQLVAQSASGLHSVSVGAGLLPGAYAQQVVEAYAELPAVTLPALPEIPATATTKGRPARPEKTSTGRLVEDVEAGVRDDADSHRYAVIQALTYSSGSVMGDPGRVTDHEHGGVQPRHVRQFVEHIARVRGGKWRIVGR